MTSGKTTEVFDFDSRRVFKKILFVLLTVVCQFSFAAELSDDFRLFFIPHEQIPLKLVSKVSGTLIDDSTGNSSAPELNTVIVKPRARWLWFNGIVQSRNRILLLVNDLPCEIIPDEVSNHARNYETANCKHITQKNYSFNLLTDKQALRVYKDGQYIATLLVGQSL